MKRSILPLVIFATMQTNAQNNEHYMLVGTYNSPKSEGIYVYKFNSETGDVTPVSSVATKNPSYLSVSPDEKYVYAVHEVDRSNIGGSVSAFNFDKGAGTLAEINLQSTGGDHPCYVEVDKTGKWVFAGNYSSGSLSLFPVNKDGSLQPSSKHIQHTGKGAHPTRQDKPHVHCTYISPDNKWLFVPDLGIDKVMIYSFNAKKGKLAEGKQPFSLSTPGAGPRHITFHPNGKYAYLIQELTGHVVAYKYDKGTLTELQRISTIQEGKTGYAGSADIHVSPDGRFLYATNRGDFNDIASYKIDPDKGTLTNIGFQSTLGKAPRNFNFDPSGNFLLIGNQDSDQVVIFKRNKETGELTDTGKRIDVGKPVCIKWISLGF